MRVLDVKDRVLRRLPLGQVEIEVEMAVVLAKQEKKPHHVGTDLVDQLIERDVGRLARRHLDLLAGARERHELVDDRANRR